jgi:hypothetical protein
MHHQRDFFPVTEDLNRSPGQAGISVNLMVAFM